MKKLVKKAAAIVMPAVLTFTLVAAAMMNAPVARAEAAKEQIQLSGGASYIGEVLNGKPHGEGTISWGAKKQYTGHFANGQRSGEGKFVNEYVDDQGSTHEVAFDGTWSKDMMFKGIYTEKVTDTYQRVTVKLFMNGKFKDNQLQSGYLAQRALSDPDYAFTYKDGKETLYVMGTPKDMVNSWKKGTLFYVKYQKGSISKECWDIPGETKTKERARQQTIQYLKKITAQVTPQLKEFEKLAKQVEIK
ncbi:hypothetical protein ACFQ3W_01270 [Paenibacillus puldeungensis]|uniref:MORN repeat-containing protein n=1 Tax=Paenibacillus puldeungensis TaxID=696536 RepID=A0ABW3RR60_9BACL